MTFIRRLDRISLIDKFLERLRTSQFIDRPVREKQTGEPPAQPTTFMVDGATAPLHLAIRCEEKTGEILNIATR